MEFISFLQVSSSTIAPAARMLQYVSAAADQTDLLSAGQRQGLVYRDYSAALPVSERVQNGTSGATDCTIWLILPQASSLLCLVPGRPEGGPCQRGMKEETSSPLLPTSERPRKSTARQAKHHQFPGGVICRSAWMARRDIKPYLGHCPLHAATTPRDRPMSNKLAEGGSHASGRSPDGQPAPDGIGTGHCCWPTHTPDTF